MDYFLSHVGYAMLVGLFVAALGLGVAYFAWRSQKLNEEHGYDPAWDKSEFACAGCKSVGVCHGMAKLKEEMDAKKAKEACASMKAAETDAAVTETPCGHAPVVGERTDKDDEMA